MKTNVTLLICLILAATSCSSKEGETQSKAMRVQVASVEEQAVEAKKEFSFISKPYRSSELSFRVSGPIVQFDVQAGNYYKQGTLIAEIDPRDFKLRKQRAEAVYHQAKEEFNRIEVLYQKNNISASAYEKAKADYTSAEMAFETAANELNDTKLIAPFSGYVGETYIEQHQDVKATQPVVSFVDISQLKIEAYVPQSIAFNAGAIDNISLAFDADPSKRYAAKLLDISKSTTRNNLSYLLSASLPNPTNELLAGMSGKLFFDMKSKGSETLIVVPQKAVCHRPTLGDYLWVIDSATMQARVRKVTLGALLPNGLVSISSGVQPHETVAISGLRFLSEGMSVVVNQN